MPLRRRHANRIGLLAAAWTQERGGTPALRNLFQGFRANLWSLVAIGVFFVVGITTAVFASSLVDGGKLIELMGGGSTLTEAELAALLAEYGSSPPSGSSSRKARPSLRFR